MFRTLNDKTYFVGGCVRDKILGIESNDIDYVIEATKEEFESVFPDAKCVGNHFPIYLHPETGEEIALTRTEKSSGNGYNDFVVTGIGVSLKSDLYRRDFPFNMIAKNFVTGEIVDPFGGIEDIKNKVINVVNQNVFIDDPVRILRCIRFSLRFNFRVEVGVMKLMKEHAHRLQHVTRERIELELFKVYEQCKEPSNFFRALEHIGGLGYCGFEEFEEATKVPAGSSKWHPKEKHHIGIDDSASVFDHMLDAFDYCKRNNMEYSVAIASLLHDLGKIITPKELLPKHHQHECRKEVLESFLAKHRFDAETMTLAKIVFRKHMKVHLIGTMSIFKTIRFLRSIRRHKRKDFLFACCGDFPLTDRQLDIIGDVFHAIDTVKLNVTKEIQAKGKEAIDYYIDNAVYVWYKEIIRGEA